MPPSQIESRWHEDRREAEQEETGEEEKKDSDIEGHKPPAEDDPSPPEHPPDFVLAQDGMPLEQVESKRKAANQSQTDPKRLNSFLRCRLRGHPFS
jgi:hypothetical protein